MNHQLHGWCSHTAEPALSREGSACGETRRSRGRGTAATPVHKNERGSAVLVVLTLTLVIAALLVVNARMIHQLRQDLQRVEKQQQERYAR